MRSTTPLVRRSLLAATLLLSAAAVGLVWAGGPGDVACGDVRSVVTVDDPQVLAALQRCTSLRTDLILALPQSRGLERLRRVRGLVVTDPRVKDLEGLAGLEAAGVTGVTLRGPLALEDLRGLGRLRVTVGGLVVEGTTHLESLAGLERLAGVGTQLRISDNAHLKDLSALRRLRPVKLEGADARWLTRPMPGKCRADPALTSVVITHNPQLPEREVRALVAQWKWFKGHVEICGNGGGQPCPTEPAVFTLDPGGGGDLGRIEQCPVEED